MSSGGQIVGGALGAVAGFFLAGPLGVKAATAMMYGAQIGMMAGGYLDPPKGPTINGPRLSDLSVQTSTYGSVIPRVYGTVTVNGNVFWLENNTIKETVTKKKQGGKGGGAKSTTRTYTYSATFAVGLCKGPIAGVRRIWIGADLYYDAGSNDPATIQASNAAATGFEVYNGTDTQAADPRMQATLGVANTPAWRGLAYIVFSDLPLAKYGNSLAGAQVRVEVMQLAQFAGSIDVEWFSLPSTTSHSGPLWDGAQWYGMVLVSTTSPRIVTSTDMTSWAQNTSLPSPYVWRWVRKVGTAYIVTAPAVVGVASGAVGMSTDLVNWSVPLSIYIGHWNWKWIVPGNGGVLIVESEQGTGNYSGNGTRTFFSANLGVDYNYGWLAPNVSCYDSRPCYNGSVFVVAGMQAGLPVLFTSTTGIGAWTARTVPSGVSHVFGVEAFGSSILLCGFQQSTNTGRVSISHDSGVTWSAWVDLPPSLGSSGWRNPTWNGAEFLVVEQAASQWATSADGVNWQAGTTAVGSPTYALGTEAGWNGSAWGVFSHEAGGAYLLTGGSGPGITPLDTTLGAIVSAECLQSGLLTAADLDITALTQTVRGYRIGSLGSIRAALEPLQASWPFDIVQAGYKIKFAARGGASVVTIPASDLDARSDGSAPGVQLTTVREMDSQLPRRVTVQYLDHAREYNTGVQYAERLNTSSVNSLTLELPIVLTATEAAGKAEVLLYMYWLERHDLLFNLPPTYNQLEPGDVVTLNMPEGTSSLRLVSVTNSSDGRVECQAKRAAAAIYTPAAIGVASAVTGPVTLTPVGASVYVLLDLPEISTAQNTPCFLAAMTGVLTGWDGGSLMQSTDSGSTWVDLHDFGAPGCTMGTASTVIGSVDSRVMDNGSVLTVVLSQGTLSSVTQLALFGGANYFAYGVNGRWEIIAAMTCTLVSGSTYTLSNFLRGRFGTEQYMGTHVIGDSIVLLDTVDLALIVMGVGTIGLPYLYRGITYDRDIGTDGDRTFAYSAVNLKPLAPIYLTGNRDSSNNWEFTWIRRTRDGGEWRDNVDAALGEASEAYQIDIYSDGTYATVKRTISATSPTAAYTSADQTTDFGSNQGTLYLKLYQISATVGRGYPLTTSITR